MESKQNNGKGIIVKMLSRYQNTNVAVKASIWFTICSVVQKGISVITMPIFTRLMSTEQYGRYNVFLTWYNIINLLVTLNIHQEPFNKGLISHSEERDDYTASQAGLLITLAILWIGIYLLFHEFFNRILGLSTIPGVFIILQAYGSAIFGLWGARKRFRFEYQAIVRMTLAISILNPVIGTIAISVTEQKAEAKLIANAIVPLAVSSVILVLFSRRGKLFGNRQWWKPTILTCLPLVPHYLSLVLINQSDKVMINAFTGPEYAAIYSVAHSAGLFMTIINGSINGSYVPWAYEKLKNGQEKDIKKVSGSLFAIVMLVNVGLIWIAPELIRILAAPQYAEAAWCLVPIAMSVFFTFVYTLFIDMEIYYGANHYVAIATACAAIMNIILNYLFIPVYGYIAAGYTTLFCYFTMMILHMLFLRHVLKKNGKTFELFDMRIVAVLSVIMVALSAGAMLLYNNRIVRWAVIVAALIAVGINYKRIIRTINMLKQKG